MDTLTVDRPVRRFSRAEAMRFVNEEICLVSVEMTGGGDAEWFEFVCECDASTCHRVLRLTVAQYRTLAARGPVRAH